MASPMILYKWAEQPQCNLPSVSPACVQAEAYIRFSSVTFQVQSCASTSKSPTGQLPAVEHHADIVGTDRDEFLATRAVIAYVAKHGKDLDAFLTSAQRAELLAFTGLIRDRLDVATDISMWIEPRGFREHKQAAYGSTLPFPLNHVVPWSQQREQRKRHGHRDIEEVYKDAVEALKAFSDRLISSSGQFLFGTRPTSLDALLVGHLAFYRASPAAAPVLRDLVCGDAALSAYVDHVLTTYFAAAAPQASDSRAGGGAQASGTSWSEAGKGHRTRVPKVEPTAAELEMRRRAWYWVAGAGASVACYILFSGRFPEVFEWLGAVGQSTGFYPGADVDDDDDAADLGYEDEDDE